MPVMSTGNIHDICKLIITAKVENLLAEIDPKKPTSPGKILVKVLKILFLCLFPFLLNFDFSSKLIVYFVNWILILVTECFS